MSFVRVEEDLAGKSRLDLIFDCSFLSEKGETCAGML